MEPNPAPELEHVGWCRGGLRPGNSAEIALDHQRARLHRGPGPVAKQAAVGGTNRRSHVGPVGVHEAHVEVGRSPDAGYRERARRAWGLGGVRRRRGARRRRAAARRQWRGKSVVSAWTPPSGAAVRASERALGAPENTGRRHRSAGESRRESCTLGGHEAAAPSDDRGRGAGGLRAGRPDPGGRANPRSADVVSRRHPEIDRLFGKAWEAMERGERRRRSACSARSSSGPPRSRRAGIKRATIRYLAEDFSGAVSDCEETLRRNPHPTSGRSRVMGLCHSWRLGQYREAARGSSVRTLAVPPEPRLGRPASLGGRRDGASGFCGMKGNGQYSRPSGFGERAGSFRSLVPKQWPSEARGGARGGNAGRCGFDITDHPSRWGGSAPAGGRSGSPFMRSGWSAPPTIRPIPARSARASLGPLGAAGGRRLEDRVPAALRLVARTIARTERVGSHRGQDPALARRERRRGLGIAGLGEGSPPRAGARREGDSRDLRERPHRSPRGGGATGQARQPRRGMPCARARDAADTRRGPRGDPRRRGSRAPACPANMHLRGRPIESPHPAPRWRTGRRRRGRRESADSPSLEAGPAPFGGTRILSRRMALTVAA
jgi:hypothetical protein